MVKFLIKISLTASRVNDSEKSQVGPKTLQVIFISYGRNYKCLMKFLIGIEINNFCLQKPILLSWTRWQSIAIIS
ncbi:unnamed protein product [Blepharisma stoltei]|uniref:Uncharacterized protein n=1 Tax=Blepharisma stoltei TaxID=1481888 RepID=A0AAU9IW97_9CILI|nr:unnamed protein product [Blepharisma stoltei]